MFKLRALLTCTLSISFVGSPKAAPLDLPGTVYVDGLPCNSACQSYMAWSRQVSGTRDAQPVPPRLARPSWSATVQRTTKVRESIPKRPAPSRIATKAAPKRIELPSTTNRADPQIAKHEEPKPAPAVKADLSSVPYPTPGSEVGKIPEQVANAPTGDDLSTGATSPVPEKPAESGTGSSSAAVSPADAGTTALAPPDNVDRLVAILLVRPEIKSVSDLGSKVVAIDISPPDSVAGVRSAIVAAGAPEVNLSEGERLALIRVMDGEVQAAVVGLLSPKAAEAWECRTFRLQRPPYSTALLFP